MLRFLFLIIAFLCVKAPSRRRVPPQEAHPGGVTAPVYIGEVQFELDATVGLEQDKLQKKKLKGTLKVFYFLTCTSLLMYFVYPVSLWSKMWRSNRTCSRPMVEACKTKIP